MGEVSPCAYCHEPNCAKCEQYDSEERLRLDVNELKQQMKEMTALLNVIFPNNILLQKAKVETGTVKTTNVESVENWRKKAQRIKS